MGKVFRLRTWLALLALASLVVSACTPALPATPSPGGTPSPGDTPPTGGTPPPATATAPATEAAVTPTPAGGPSGELVVGLSAESESMDPYFVYQAAGNSIMEAIFDSLLSFDRDGNVGTGGLAESVEVIDETTLEFQLRSGITFHNGEPLNAEAVKFSLDRVRDESLASGLAGQYESIESVDAVDELTVRVNLSQPDASINSNLATLEIVPPAYIAEVGDSGFAAEPVGTGPFVFVEWVRDDHTLLRANESYWSGSWKGMPMVETVRFRPIPQASQRIDELTTGGVHIIMDLPPDQMGALDGTGSEPVYADDGHHFEIWLTANMTGQLAEGGQATPEQQRALEALSNLDVRRALNMAVDRQAIIDALLGGFGQPMTHLFVPGDRGYDSSIPEYAHDPDTARQLLADAGFADGFEVDIDFCTCDRIDLVEAVQGQLADIGVQLNIVSSELQQFNDDWIAGATNPMRSARLGFAADPNIYLQFWVRSGGLLSRYTNEEIDALIDQQAATLDTDERVDLLRQIGQVSHDDPPAIFLWSMGSLYGKRDGVDWQAHPLGYIPVFDTSASE